MKIEAGRLKLVADILVADILVALILVATILVALILVALGLFQLTFITLDYNLPFFEFFEDGSFIFHACIPFNYCSR